MAKRSRNISEKAKKNLLTLSNGTCALCQEAIIKMNESGNFTMFGEFAHINGLQEGAARYSESVSENIINDESNIILLCRNCHKIVDDNETKYPVEILKKLKSEHEMETLESIETVVNKTKVGGYKSFEKFDRYSDFLLNGEEPDDEFRRELESAKKLVNGLKNISLPVRSALYDLSKDVVINKLNEKLKQSFWMDCYPSSADQHAIIDPLCNWGYIYIDDWKESDELDPELDIVDDWKWIIEYLNDNNFSLETTILDRDFSVFDKSPKH
ncbi:hypothetical protein AZI11_12950 (plasmid) [Levilactobacillus brevis]|uniref:HNH endonuclease n=1 Tax=Levilactobacillus brevis TaxID=1580 RepID=UPI000A2020B8|nr:HNH endonuclease [Levilactobacillus brevis]ARN93847.1 hypothetical protein AZI11_12950 [Levilactobacillus brevis]ARN96483.1 hypothetical protein AZI12_13375 [Levilactobacillus brevis]